MSQNGIVAGATAGAPGETYLRRVKLGGAEALDYPKLAVQQMRDCTTFFGSMFVSSSLFAQGAERAASSFKWIW
jgi:hypothetical protein